MGKLQRDGGSGSALSDAGKVQRDGGNGAPLSEEGERQGKNPSKGAPGSGKPADRPVPQRVLDRYNDFERRVQQLTGVKIPNGE